MIDLTKYGMAPAGAGAFGGAGGAPSAPPPQPPDAPPIYGPDDDPFSWESIVLSRAGADGTNVAYWQWPLIRGAGLAVFTAADSEQKLDVQKAAGTDKAKTKQTGIEPWKGTLVLTIPVAYWGNAIPMLIDLNPNGPSKGLPFAISHPEARLAGVKSVQIRKVSMVKWKPGGRIATVTYELEEWTPPAKAKSTGTNTPETVGQQYYAYNFHAVGPDGKQTGFDSPKSGPSSGAP